MGESFNLNLTPFDLYKRESRSPLSSQCLCCAVFSKLSAFGTALPWREMTLHDVLF